MEMLPEALPAAVGANLALKVVFWPALRVIGAVIPLRLKPVPATDIWVMVRFAVPGLLMAISGCWSRPQ